MNNAYTGAVSIVIPAYQESRSVGQVVRTLIETLQFSERPYEIIVVDDGSTDDTATIAESAGATVIVHPYNCGYGAALKSRVRAASYPTVVFLDADGQHNPNDILRLLAERKNFDMVVGARARSQGSPMWRKPGKLFLSWFANHMTGRKIPDFNSGFRAIDRMMALKILPLMPNGFSFSTTSTITAFRCGYRVKYVPIQVTSRTGKSSVRISDGFKTMMLIIRITTIFSPLRVFIPISLLTFSVGVGFTVNSYIAIGESSVRGLIALLASFQFFLFGILVDQVAAVRRGEGI